MIASRRGVSAIYLVVYLVVLSAFCSLAVDLGRVQLAKTELRRAADGAARAAAAGLLTNPDQAISLARQFANLNNVDGVPLNLESQDIQLGRWDAKTRVFTNLTGGDLSRANAVRIIARRSNSRGNGIPMLFASLLGFHSCNISAESIAVVIPPTDVDQYVPATANPFLSGMPAGSVASRPNPHNSPDYAGSPGNPRQSPLAINMTIEEGQILTFDSIEGTARHDPNLPFFDPDGELTDIGHNNLTGNHNSSYGSRLYNENGIADVIAPINSLVGVFLDDNPPNLTPAPENLDFSTPASRDFAQLRPKLKQIFFIGDGLRSDGARQQFIVPAGATRLYLATWDFYEWNNNYGFRNIKVQRPMQIVTVR